MIIKFICSIFVIVYSYFYIECCTRGNGQSCCQCCGNKHNIQKPIDGNKKIKTPKENKVIQQENGKEKGQLKKEEKENKEVGFNIFNKTKSIFNNLPFDGGSIKNGFFNLTDSLKNVFKTNSNTSYSTCANSNKDINNLNSYKQIITTQNEYYSGNKLVENTLINKYFYTPLNFAKNNLNKTIITLKNNIGKTITTFSSLAYLYNLYYYNNNKCLFYILCNSYMFLYFIYNKIKEEEDCLKPQISDEEDYLNYQIVNKKENLNILDKALINNQNPSFNDIEKFIPVLQIAGVFYSIAPFIIEYVQDNSVYQNICYYLYFMVFSTNTVYYLWKYFSDNKTNKNTLDNKIKI